MDYNYKNFVEYLNRFVCDLNRYVPTDILDDYLRNYEKCDMTKIILRYYTVLKEKENLLKEKNEELFSSSLIILPDVDMEYFWGKLGSGQKAKVWIYLNMLFIQSELLVEYAKKINTETLNNVYMGVGKDNENYGVNEMALAVKDIPDSVDKPGLTSAMKLMGFDIDKVMGDLASGLKNIDKEEILKVTESFKNILGKEDTPTSKFITEMVTSASGELLQASSAEGSPDLMGIASRIAERLRPKWQDQNIDRKNIISLTKQLAEGCVDENGKKLLGEDGGPMSMISNMMENASTMNPAQMMSHCQDIMKTLGVNPAMLAGLMKKQ